MKPKGKAKGGHARAAKLSPARRSAIAKKAAKARWGDTGLSSSLVPKRIKVPKIKTKRNKTMLANWREITGQTPDRKQEWENFKKFIEDGGVLNIPSSESLRDDIARSVLTGLYANIDKAQLFVAHVMGGTMPLPEALVRVAYAQADEAIRLRSL